MSYSTQDYSHDYWSVPAANLFEQLNNITTQQEREQQQETGLTSTEANRRLSKYQESCGGKEEGKFNTCANLSVQESYNSDFYFHLYIIIFSWSNRGCYNHYYQLEQIVTKILITMVRITRKQLLKL